MKVLVLFGTVIGAVISFLAVFYFLAISKFLAWTIFSLVAREWSQAVWQNKILILSIGMVSALKRIPIHKLG
jgi:hypothetical protein